MHRNLSIIKLFLIGFIFIGYTKLNACSYSVLGVEIQATNVIIDTSHKLLETSVENYYNANIKPILVDIDNIQIDIAKAIVHMRTLEKEANLDEQKLLFLLSKNQNQLDNIEDK